ncbi:hypothetical protein Tco_0224392, partial [Tanacetum coccineum]
MGLWYPKDSGFELTAFLDADHAGCLDTVMFDDDIQAVSFVRTSSSAGVKHLIPILLTRYLNRSSGRAL